MIINANDNIYTLLFFYSNLSIIVIFEVDSARSALLILGHLRLFFLLLLLLATIILILVLLFFLLLFEICEALLDLVVFFLSDDFHDVVLGLN